MSRDAVLEGIARGMGPFSHQELKALCEGMELLLARVNREIAACPPRDSSDPMSAVFEICSQTREMFEIAQYRSPKRRRGARARSKRSSVYFIQRGVDGPIKIGVSSDLRKRIGTLQTACHERLALLLTIPGSYGEESALRVKFRHLRLRGEWYRPESDLLLFIATLGAKATE